MLAGADCGALSERFCKRELCDRVLCDFDERPERRLRLRLRRDSRTLEVESLERFEDFSGVSATTSATGAASSTGATLFFAAERRFEMLGLGI